MLEIKKKTFHLPSTAKITLIASLPSIAAIGRFAPQEEESAPCETPPPLHAIATTHPGHAHMRPGFPGDQGMKRPRTMYKALGKRDLHCSRCEVNLAGAVPWLRPSPRRHVGGEKSRCYGQGGLSTAGENDKGRVLSGWWGGGGFSHPLLYSVELLRTYTTHILLLDDGGILPSSHRNRTVPSALPFTVEFPSNGVIIAQLSSAGTVMSMTSFPFSL